MKYLALILVLFVSGCEHLPAKSSHVRDGDEKISRFAKAVAKEFKDNLEIQLSSADLQEHAEKDAGYAKEGFMLLDLIGELSGVDIASILGLLGLGGTTLHARGKYHKSEKKMLAKLNPEDAEKEI